MRRRSFIGIAAAAAAGTALMPDSLLWRREMTILEFVQRMGLTPPEGLQPWQRSLLRNLESLSSRNYLLDDLTWKIASPEGPEGFVVDIHEGPVEP